MITSVKGGRAVAVILAVVAALLAEAGCAAPTARAQGPVRPIRIGYQSDVDWMVLTARNLKLFGRAGLAPTFVKFTTDASMIDAARAGSIDVSSVGSVPFLIGLSKGLDWVMIGIYSEGAYSEGLVVRRDAGVENLLGLRGKRIGYPPASNAEYGLMMTLSEHGVRANEATLIAMEPDRQLTALANGTIDAAMGWEPWLQRMVHQVGGRIIVREGDIGIFTNVSGYAVRREWLQGNREAAVRFLRAIVMARDTLAANPRVGLEALSAEAGIDERWAQAIYDEAPPPKISAWTEPRYAYSLVSGSGLERRLGVLADYLLGRKEIDQPVDVSGALDASVIAEAMPPAPKAQPPATAPSAKVPAGKKPTGKAPSAKTPPAKAAPDSG